MEVFISCSGDVSRQVAGALHWWLPLVLQSVTPWCSSEDLGSGKRWPSQLGEQLEKVDFGISCLTPDNLKAEWIHFEAGALSKRMNDSRVCPVLFNVEPGDIVGPLAQFQARRLTEDDVKKLAGSINDSSQTPLNMGRFESAFDMWWPKLEERLRGIPTSPQERPPRRDMHEVLDEILETVRSIERRGAPRALRGMADLLSRDPLHGLSLGRARTSSEIASDLAELRRTLAGTTPGSPEHAALENEVQSLEFALSRTQLVEQHLGIRER